MQENISILVFSYEQQVPRQCSGHEAKFPKGFNNEIPSDTIYNYQSVPSFSLAIRNSIEVLA